MLILRVQVFGDFRLHIAGDASIAINQARQQALLTYLLLHRYALQPRQPLAFLLWPDSSEAQALTNLRKTLTHLRQASPLLAQALYADHKVVQWRPPFPYTLDVADFETKLAEAAAAERANQPQDQCAALAAAVERYTGPLLPSCYDDWLLTERERLHQLCLGALTQLITLHERQRAYDTAIRYAQQLLRLDPLQETGYLQLIRLQALQGDRAGALRTYHTCATLLERELRVTPGEELQAAYARLLKLETLPQVHATGASRAQATPVAHLVGRQAEWMQLQTAWRLASRRQAQFVCVLGEAGIGKTHLAEAMLTWASQQGFAVARTRSYAGEGQLAYAPLTEWLRAAAIRVSQPQLAPVWLSEVARLLPEILTAQPTVPTPTPMTERWQRQQFWEALARALLAAPQPLLLLLDDLQWCDQETLEWLRYLFHFDPRARLLVLGTARPEEIDEAHPLQALRRHLRSADQWTELELGPLDREQTATLAVQVAQQTLAPKAQQTLYHATAGNPLFVVEMMRAEMNEQGFAMSDWGLEASPLALPPKVQAVIQARLAQLSPKARELAALAAVIGRAFSFELLIQASGYTEDTLAQTLDELWQRRIVREQGVNTYDFSHDRIRDVAYAEISPMRRRQLHRRVAKGLELYYWFELDLISGELAFHYEKAKIFEPAVLHYQRAAQIAQGLNAYYETVTHLRQGLALLKFVPVTRKMRLLEIDMLVTLGDRLSELQGLTIPEVGQIYHQALALCRLVDAKEQCYNVQSGLRVYYNNLGQWSISQQLAQENLALAQTLQDQAKIQHAHFGLGLGALATGQFASALFHFEQALQAPVKQWLLPDTGQFSIPLGLAPLVSCLWLLGYPYQCFQRIQQILNFYHQGPRSPFILSDLEFTLIGCYLLNDIQTMFQLTEAITTISTKYSFTFFQEIGSLHGGFVRVFQGETAVGLAQLQRGITFLKNNQVSMLTPYCLAYLVTIYHQLGQNELASVSLDEALTMTEQTGEYFWYAELLRLRGELLVAIGEVSNDVEAWYQRSLQVARQQQAKSLELRAAMSLARLWQQQGRVGEAHALLAEIYNWFTEGFDTADLKAARALLDTLAASSSMPATG